MVMGYKVHPGLHAELFAKEEIQGRPAFAATCLTVGSEARAKRLYGQQDGLESPGTFDVACLGSLWTA